MASIFGFTAKTDGVDDHLAAHVNALQLAADVLSGAPQGTMFNGKLSVTVSSNNLTIAIKTLANNDPSASDPVIFRIGNSLRMLTSALSVTKAKATNWFSSGATGLATQEIDYFVYIIWDTVPATDVLDIGFARIPYATNTADFVNTTTDERYIARSGTSGLTIDNECEVIGRFNAILSATAAFNWSLPATQIIINRPIYETRWLTWEPTWAGWSSAPTGVLARYRLQYGSCIHIARSGGGGTSNATTATYTLPISAKTITGGAWQSAISYEDNGAGIATTPGRVFINTGGTVATMHTNMATGAWTAANAKRIVGVTPFTYEI